MIRNIIFDWSGTLSNDILHVYETVMKMFEHFGINRISLDEFRDSYRLPYMAHARMFGIKASKEEVDAVFEQHFRRTGFPKPINGAEKTLQSLKAKGVRMIVLSSHNPALLEEEARMFFGTAHFFDGVFGDVQDKVKGIGAIMESVGFGQKDTLIVGDTEHDINAGKSAGILAVAVLSGYRSRKHLEGAGPDFVIDDVTRLFSLGVF